MLDTTTYLPKLKEFEGSISYMYLDTSGNVTVGVGNLLANAAAAQKLAFVRRANPTAKPPILPGPASLDEIKADFDNVNKQTPGRLASFYRQYTKLDLPDTVIDSLLASRVSDFLTTLKGTFPDYDSYSAEACAGIFDMAFNLGVSKLTSAFPTFCKAVKDKDWKKAGDESNRLPPVNDDRNSWTKAQFTKAADDAAAAAAKAKAAAPAAASSTASPPASAPAVKLP